MGFVGTAPAASYICSGNDAPGQARRVCSPRAQALSQLLERVIQDAPSPTRSALQRRGLRYYPSATTSQNIRCIPYISVGTTDTPWIWGFSYTLDGSSFSERLITVGSLEITIGHYLLPTSTSCLTTAAALERRTGSGSWCTQRTGRSCFRNVYRWICERGRTLGRAAARLLSTTPGR